MSDIASLQYSIAAATQRKDQASRDRDYYETKMREANDVMIAADSEIYTYQQHLQYETSRMEQLIQDAQAT